MNTNFDKLDCEIIDCLNSFFEEVDTNNYRGNTIWTKRIKEKLGELGHEKGYRVAIGGFPEKFENEWLFDVLWYVEDKQSRLKKIPLVVESELDKSYTSIKYDFEKLLVANAERRLMICQAKTDEIEHLFDYFRISIDSFEENYGDRFLIVILDSYTERDYHFRTYTKSRAGT